MSEVIQDLRYAFRALCRSPLAAAVIVITLALGIGANTAIFTIVNAVLVHALPYERSDRLVAVWLRFDSQPDQKAFATYRDFEEISQSAQSYDEVAANTWAVGGRTLSWHGEPHYVTAIPSTANLFALLGARAAQGRTFVPEDSRNGCTAVLADRFWRNVLGADPGIVSSSITLDDEECTVVGVMPPGFEFFPAATQVWTLLAPGSPLTRNPLNGVAIFARLKPGVTREAAAAEAATIHRRVGESMPASTGMLDTTLGVYSLQGEFTFLAGANLRSALLMLTAAVAIVLLICCVNIAGLLLGRGTERGKEFALRAALGSGRARLVRQLFAESLVLAAGGVCTGVVVAALAVRWFRAMNPIDLPAATAVTISWPVIAFAAAAAAVAAVVFGLLPAVKSSRVDLNEVLKASGVSVARGAFGLGSGQLLVVAQLCLSMVLLAGAGLLIQSITRLTAAPLSFRADDLLVGAVTLPRGSYAEPAARARLYDTLLARVAMLPGIEGAALSSRQPLVGSQAGRAVSVAGRPPPSSDLGNVGNEDVSESFLSMMDIALLRGRGFDSRDGTDAPAVAIVNQRFVADFLGGEEPIGTQFKFGVPDAPDPWLTIIGVVADVERADFFNEMSVSRPPIVYRPIAQHAESTMTLLARTRATTTDVGFAIQRAITSLDSRVPLHSLTTMDDVLKRNFAQPRFRTQVLGSFAVLSLLLAALGLYGLLMRIVVRRTREIGIRMALGADRRSVLRAVLREALVLTALGLLAGIAASAYLARFLAGMLYGVGRMDAWTLAETAAVLVAVALVATFLPARRATRVDPIVALRHE